MIDSKVIKAHQYVSGAKDNYFFQAVGESSGIFTTKIYVLSDGNGLGFKNILNGDHV